MFVSLKCHWCNLCRISLKTAQVSFQSSSSKTHSLKLKAKDCRLKDLKYLKTFLHLCFPPLQLQQLTFQDERLSVSHDHSSFQPGVIFPTRGQTDKNEFGLKFLILEQGVISVTEKVQAGVNTHPQMVTNSTRKAHMADANTRITHPRRKATSLNPPSGEVLVVFLYKFAQLRFLLSC